MKIGIVGSGMVGATAAYAMIMKGVGREIVLVDKNAERAKAEAYDLSHAIPFAHPLLVRSGDYDDLKNSRLIIIAAGVSQKPGESRLDLLKRNAAVFKEIIPLILEMAPETILVIATNPLDIMTYMAFHYASKRGFPAGKVLGTGTMLDTARFRTLLAEHIGIDSQHVHGYVVGEHGDSEVLTWSLVSVGGTQLEDYCQQGHIAFGKEISRGIDKRVRQAAYTIINGKGATYYGIGSALAKLAEVILEDQRSILTVSVPGFQNSDFPDLSMSLPYLIGGSGVITKMPINLDNDESQALNKSAAVIQKAIVELKEFL